MAESLSIYRGMSVKILSEVDDDFINGKVVEYDDDTNRVKVEDVFL